MFAPPPMSKLPDSVEWYLVRERVVEPRNGREGHTPGEIRYGVLDAPRVCFTVEDQDFELERGNGNPHGRSAIGIGRYQITYYNSPHNGTCIHIHAVPGFKSAEIGSNGSVERLGGSVAVGLTRTLDGVGDSKPALLRLITELRRLKKEEFLVYLNIVRAK